MSENICVQIKGEAPNEVAHIAAERLLERGINAVAQPSPDGCLLVLESENKSKKVLPVELDPHDTPDFAAEKIIDLLAENGLAISETSDYTPEEEEEIRRRLQNLGYIE